MTNDRSDVERPPIVGVDIGGTNVRAGVFHSDGRLLGSLESRPTQADRAAETTFTAIALAIERAMKGARDLTDVPIGGIGIGSTGPLDPVRGIYHEPETLPSMFGFPLVPRLSERFALPVRITNDGNAFALAEATFGAARGASTVVGITLGTGCGCGIVVDGRIHEGATANAGELFRAPLRGRNFDEWLSGRGLELTFDRERGLAAPEISRRARDGDRAALAAFERFGEVVGEGLGIVAAVVDPNVFVLGGSVSTAIDHFRPSMERRFRDCVATAVAESVRFAASQLGEESGALGGAALFALDGSARTEHEADE